jgi:hypothetical protein
MHALLGLEVNQSVKKKDCVRISPGKKTPEPRKPPAADGIYLVGR